MKNKKVILLFVSLVLGCLIVWITLDISQNVYCYAQTSASTQQQSTGAFDPLTQSGRESISQDTSLPGSFDPLSGQTKEEEGNLVPCKIGE